MSFPFDEHLALVDHFLSRRQTLVERIEQHLLNVRDKPTSRRRDRAHFAHLLNGCFFGLPGLSSDLSRLMGQLAAQHLADGFEPVVLDKFTQELDPLELVLRAYFYWEHHRWPGRSGRIAYAQTIYAVFVLRQLEGLSLRVWDDGHDLAPPRLDAVQTRLDRLNSVPAGGIFVRDARWLVQTGQGPLTRYLAPYFKVAAEISAAFPGASGIEFHAAGAKLAGGHLRSQLRYRTWETGRPADDAEILAVTRNSNSMDVALLVWDLTALLEAYQTACASADEAARLALADGVLQGLSADPELSVTRLDLLGPMTMIEEIFVAVDGDGRVGYTAMGDAHVALVNHYIALLGELAGPLRNDAANFDPHARPYSPFGIAYGFVADLLANVAYSRLVGDAPSDLSLEDTFISRGRLEDKAARSGAWHRLPVREGEHAHFDYAPDWAADTFARLVAALEARARYPERLNATDYPDARVVIVPEGAAAGEGVRPKGAVPAQEYLCTSDPGFAEMSGATLRPKSVMEADRREGRFLASVESGGQRIAVSKVLLTTLTSRGRDGVIAHVPQPIVEILRLTCPRIL